MPFKFIHLTDTHLAGPGLKLYGLDPRARLDAAIADINTHHSDAAFAVVTGDLTHWGEAEAYANFAEAIAEGRGKAQAETLRKARREGSAQKLSAPHRDASRAEVASGSLTIDDVVLIEAGGIIPSDGEIIEGVASVDESAVTGERAPVIRESGGDRSAVTGGTRVLSDWLVVRITAQPGETFLDRMIAMVELAASLTETVPSGLIVMPVS